MNKKLVYVVATLIFMVSVVISITISAEANIRPVVEVSTEDTEIESDIAENMIVAAGVCGSTNSDVIWTLTSNGLLTISGNGEMKNYSDCGAAPWYAYPFVETVMIEKGVTSVGDYAFAGCDNIKMVSLPEGMIYIGRDAFSACYDLATIILPDSLEYIETQAFMAVVNIQQIIIPAKTYLEYNAIVSCNPTIYCYDNSHALDYAEEFDLPYVVVTDSGKCGDNVYWTFDDSCQLSIFGFGKMYDYYCNFEYGLWGNTPWFDFRDNVKTLFIDENITYIGDFAFAALNELSKIVWNAKEISMVYHSCFISTGAEEGISLIFTDNVNIIPEGIWGNGKLYESSFINVKSITVGKNVSKIMAGVFPYYLEDGCTNTIDSLYIDSVDSWVQIQGCGYLLPDKSIGTEIKNIYFDGKLAKDIVISDKVTHIEDGAFSGLDSIETITIGENVKTIGFESFENCRSVKKIIWNAKNASCDIYSFRNVGAASDGIDLIFGDSVEYFPSLIWYDGWYYSGINLKSVKLGKNIKEIHDHAFYDADYLEEIVLPDGLLTIGSEAFYGCNNLTSIEISDTVKSIGYSAFKDCTNLMNVIIGESVVNIDNSAFANCDSLTSITIPDSTKTISKLAFISCDNLIEVKLGDNVEIIGDAAFEGCEKLKTIVLNDGLKSIGDSAFEMCAIESIIIPDSVENIGKYAISYCGNLRDVIIGNGVLKLSENLFAHCNNLESVIIGNSVQEIDYYVFGCCFLLKNIVIPESTMRIATDAFSYSGLEKIVINNPKCVIEYSASTIPVDAVIYGYENSPAQMYAQMYGREFVALAAAECEHSYSEWVIDADATCTQRGFAHRVCSLCNGYEFDVIDETGHIDEDTDNICDVCDEVLSSQTPDIDDGGESDDNNSSDGILSFLESIKELFNKIISWFRSILGMV